MARPTEYGIRFTPGMARAMGRLFTKQVLVRRYELQDDRTDEAGEAIARRLMEVAHANQEQGQELWEFVFTKALEHQNAARAGRGSHGMTPEFGKGIADRVLPQLPAAREAVHNVVQDLRPMLPVKQQLKLGADLMAVDTAIDAFEKNMQRWAKGEVEPFQDPFEEKKEIEVSESGESKALERARANAQQALDRGQWSDWEKYVEDAKKLYEMDDSQSATADSILREVTERAKSVARDENRRQRLYRNRLWQGMIWPLRLGWGSPLRHLIEQDYATINEPIEVLGDELKDRIDDIPTQPQREAVGKRLAAALAEKGFKAGED